MDLFKRFEGMFGKLHAENLKCIDIIVGNAK